MSTTLQELTDKIYVEGVEKGKAEASAIIAQAEQKADTIISEAKAEAARLLQEADQKRAEADKNTRSELRLFADQSVSAIKTEITNLLSDKIASDSVHAATADPKFMQQIITSLAQQFAKGGEVVIEAKDAEAKDAEALKKYFAANAKGLLDKGVEIRQVKGITDATLLVWRVSAYNGTVEVLRLVWVGAQVTLTREVAQLCVVVDGVFAEIQLGDTACGVVGCVISYEGCPNVIVVVLDEVFCAEGARTFHNFFDGQSGRIDDLHFAAFSHNDFAVLSDDSFWLSIQFDECVDFRCRHVYLIDVTLLLVPVWYGGHEERSVRDGSIPWGDDALDGEQCLEIIYV